jgi:amidase
MPRTPWIVITSAVTALAPFAAPLGAQSPRVRDIVHEASITELQEGLRRGTWTSVQLVDAYLARIAAYDQRGPALNAMIRLNPNARRDAAALDAERRRGTMRGALHGIPIVLKDNFDTADLPTSAASLALATVQPPDDGFVVKRLRAAGAVIIGKTNMHELAAGITSVSSLGGQTRNPYDPLRCPGGSSGGTGAAVAASFAAVGWGSDTCGSIRIPSAFNNLVGLRPTQGLASRDGVVPLSHTQDVPGPLARSARDLAIALDVTIGHDPADTTTQVARTWSPTAFTDSLTAFPMRETRLAVLTNYMTGDTDTDIRDTVRARLKAMEAAGAKVVDVRIADFDSLLANTGVIGFETEPDLEDYLRSMPGARARSVRDILGTGFFHESMWGRIVSMDTMGTRDNEAYRRALSRRALLRTRLVWIMDSLGVDAIVYPTSRRRPVLVGEPQPGGTCALSANSGLPALSAPAGFTDAGLPVGVELLGRPFSDVRLVGFAHALEQLEWRREAPSTTPPLRAGRAPAPVARTQVVQGMGARAIVRLTMDPLSNVLSYDVSVSGVRAPELHAVVLRRNPASAAQPAGAAASVGAPVIHRMAGPGMLSSAGSFPLSGADRRALADGRLQLTMVTSRGVAEAPVRAVSLANGNAAR